MAREKNWQFVWNSEYLSASDALDLHRYTLWFIAATLTGNFGGMTGSGLWTLYASSDSVTAGTDSTDRWQLAGPYDGTKIVRGNSTAAHSWIVLKSPYVNGSYWYMTLSFNTSNDTYLRLIFSKNAPTGGSTTVTARDTATQWSFNMYGAGGGGAEFPFSPSIVRQTTYCMSLADDGQFVFHAGRKTLSEPTHTIWFIPTVEYDPLDNYPILTWFYYNDTGCYTSAPVGGQKVVGPVTQSIILYTGIYAQGRNFNGFSGAASDSNTNTLVHLVSGVGFPTVYEGNPPVFLPPIIGGKNVKVPILVWFMEGSQYNYETRTPTAYRGKIKDLYWSSQNNGVSHHLNSGPGVLPGNNATIPSTGDVEYVVLSYWMFPAPSPTTFA